jgi:signal peptidase I
MRKLWRGLLWTAGVLLVLALVLRLTAFDVWTVTDDPYIGASLAPTLAGGDTVILLRRGTPGFGDLVRCVDPQDPKAFVLGRIAGVEGDTVEIEGPRLRVNGRDYGGSTACAEPKIHIKHPETQKEIELSCDVVEMGGGWHYRATMVQQFTEQKKTKTVGPGMFFLVSDNRLLHDDSRDYGLVQRDTCAERPVVRLWSKAGWTDEKSRLTYVH